MEEKKNSIKIKKIIATLLVTLGLAVAASCVVNLLSMALNTDALTIDMEDWLQDKEYVESDTLHWHLASDMARIIEYMGLRQLLEDQGTLNLDRPALVIQTQDGSIVTYTMADLVKLGEENGIYVYDTVDGNDGEYPIYYEEAIRDPQETLHNIDVRVLWALRVKEDAAVDLGEDAWKVRQERIQAAITLAESEGSQNLSKNLRIPEESELSDLRVEELLTMCRELTKRYPDVQPVPDHLLEAWQEELNALRQEEQELETMESAAQDAADMPQETTEDLSTDDGEEIEETEEAVTMEVPVVEIVSGQMEPLSVREYKLRQCIYDVLAERRDSQQAHWNNLYDEIYLFLRMHLAEYYQYRQLLEQPGNLNYRITLTQGDQVLTVTDVQSRGKNDFAVPMDRWDVSYAYDSTTRQIKTTLPASVREYPLQTMANYSCVNYDEYTVTFGINTQELQAYEDAYYQEKASYEQYRSQIFALVGIMAICALAVLVGMVWLIPLCGHRDGTEEIHLNLYDRIPTELGAFGICLLFMGMFLVFVGAREFSYWIMYETVAADVKNWIMIGLAAALLILVYLALWLGLYGLIRRIKAHTFWKNSLCAILLRWCMIPLRWCWQKVRWCGAKVKAGWHALLDGGDVTWKTAAMFIGYLLINFFLCVSYMNYYDGFFFMLMLVFNVLVGAYLILKSAERKRVRQGVTQIASGKIDHHLPLHNLTGEERKLAEQINRIGGGLKTAVEDSLKNERMKTELITNVSHDIKTPLTSIINYVDLLKRENIEDPKIRGYIDVLDQKSQRLKTLTEDLVEASKASSGTLKLTREKIDFVELIHQTTGEFSDRFAACNLNLVTSIPETPSYIMADGRYVWRILENLYRNAEKYSMPGTRVYIEVFEKIGRVFFVMKNVSNAPLNIKAEELTERFIRGDGSRTTEGSGLGLSIAKDMTELMSGTFRIYLDGDLFRVTVSFAVIPDQKTDLKEMEENIRRRVTEEENKVQVETADVVAESGLAKSFPIEAEMKTSAEPEVEEAGLKPFGKRLPKLPKLSLPHRKKRNKNEAEQKDDSFTV